MFMLHKGDCEHCHRTYLYTLWQASFGEFSYVYCDTCGMLATISYSSEYMASLPPIQARYREIDAAWLPFLAPCVCGGSFKKGAAPRCVYCKAHLSAEYAAIHIMRNVKGAVKNWTWQGNWSDQYCMAIADPKNVGNLRHRIDPFLDQEAIKNEKGRANVLGMDR